MVLNLKSKKFNITGLKHKTLKKKKMLNVGIFRNIVDRIFALQWTNSEKGNRNASIKCVYNFEAIPLNTNPYVIVKQQLLQSLSPKIAQSPYIQILLLPHSTLYIS